MAKILFGRGLITVMLLLLLAGVDTRAVQSAANQPPVITIWGDPNLKFGQLGNPQNQIDILGNVSDPDGTVASLTYSLNGGSVITLSLGPNGARLNHPGDFNAAIRTTNLLNGSNTVVFSARDNTGEVQTRIIMVKYTRGKTWPLPYRTNWSAATSIQDQAQIVDGMWSMGANGIRPTQFGYDRLVAIGDIRWKDYEVLVPITVREFQPNQKNPIDAGGIGVIVRWQGHIGPGQPPEDWTRLGAYGYYSNRLGALALRLDRNDPITQSFSFRYNTTYLYKLRVETVSQGSRYSFKIWQQGQPEPDWGSPQFSKIVNVVDSNSDLQSGSVLLVAHRVDATFGNVIVNNISLPVEQPYKAYVPFTRK